MILPPYAELLGLSVDMSAADGPVVTMPFAAGVSGRPGFLHGGALGGMLEMAAIVALRAALDDANIVIKPVNLTVDYMRGGREKDTFAAAHIRRLGTRIANIDATAWQDDRANPIASARLTFLIRR
ncbi:PaaI family thioesterase [Sphingomonas donggukensis]|uniref:PaaI family thioesterase n=1 Tax=Sphingomonas donggukensis TaxID=2949093 RepID=A0ABY4TTC0_9SPHN|nr:PaaI family thioesterase [Sphingomonas donggukensis]URW75653.1 PaaI family thioesterase [Sphingomonas donggukensis]